MRSERVYSHSSSAVTAKASAKKPITPAMPSSTSPTSLAKPTILTSTSVPLNSPRIFSSWRATEP
ncbi:hypothetical protein D9M72_302640 [compost metagenome]